MTILNLNGPAGREPRSKKTVRAWMGVGLVIAVLGIGSTFAANINISNNDESEFGQGVTKTVFCGSTQDEITITPASKFTAATVATVPGRAAVPSTWIAPTWSGTPTFQEVDSSATKYRFQSTYINDTTGLSTPNVNGYWIQSNRSSSSVFQNYTAPTSGYVFVPQAVGNSSTAWASRSSSATTSGSQKYGYWKYQSWNPGSWTVAVAGTPPVKIATPSDFELGGITVSGIDPDCDGKNFVISAYGGPNEETNALMNLVGDYDEIAVLYRDVDELTEATFSFSRNGLTLNPKNFANVDNDVAQFIIKFTGTGKIDTDDLKNIVIETQDNLLTTPVTGGNDDDEDED